MSVFTVTREFLDGKHFQHLRFLDRDQLEQLQQHLKYRFAHLEPASQSFEGERCDLHSARLVCRNENISPADILAVCLRAL